MLGLAAPELESLERLPSEALARLRQMEELCIFVNELMVSAGGSKSARGAGGYSSFWPAVLAGPAPHAWQPSNSPAAIVQRAKRAGPSP